MPNPERLQPKQTLLVGSSVLSAEIQSPDSQISSTCHPRVEGAVNIYGPGNAHAIRLVGRNFVSDEISIKDWNNKSEDEKARILATGVLDVSSDAVEFRSEQHLPITIFDSEEAAGK